MPNNKFTAAVKKAKTLYKTGRYKTFGDAVKAAYKKVGSVGATKKKYRQTGTSSRKADSQRKAKRPGKRKSRSGKVYTERRKNRSDMPGKLTGIGAGTLKSELRRRLAERQMKLLAEKHHTVLKTVKRKLSKEINAIDRQLLNLK